MQETWVPSLGQEGSLEKEMATHSSILACRIPWTEEPGGRQSMGLQTVGQDVSTNHHHICPGEIDSDQKTCTICLPDAKLVLGSLCLQSMSTLPHHAEDSSAALSSPELQKQTDIQTGTSMELTPL